MKSELQKGLEWLAEDFGINVRSYSGCLAFTTDDLNLLHFGIALGEWANEEDLPPDAFVKEIRRMRSENFGLGTVYYFPGLKYVENK